MHADRPGDRPRILYWYRTAPGVILGRAALDEDAIRTIEDQHPGIEFDWPAILALSEVMTPEDEAPPPRPQSSARKPANGRKNKREPRRDDRSDEPRGTVEHDAHARRDDDVQPGTMEPGTESAAPPAPETELDGQLESAEPSNRLTEELAGREVGARLRRRHAEILSRIDALDVDGAEKDALFKRAEAIDPELWMTPEAVLDGVRNADALFEQLKAALGPPSL
jgi:hypothetical protein